VNLSMRRVHLLSAAVQAGEANRLACPLYL
jgi:hypothetical protein